MLHDVKPDSSTPRCLGKHPGVVDRGLTSCSTTSSRTAPHLRCLGKHPGVLDRGLALRASRSTTASLFSSAATSIALRHAPREYPAEPFGRPQSGQVNRSGATPRKFPKGQLRAQASPPGRGPVVARATRAGVEDELICQHFEVCARADGLHSGVLLRPPWTTSASSPRTFARLRP